jgi:hypothetical protein
VKHIGIRHGNQLEATRDPEECADHQAGDVGRRSKWSLNGGPGDGGRLAAGEQPAGRDGRPWNAHDY